MREAEDLVQKVHCHSAEMEAQLLQALEELEGSFSSSKPTSVPCIFTWHTSFLCSPSSSSWSSPLVSLI